MPGEANAGPAIKHWRHGFLPINADQYLGTARLDGVAVGAFPVRPKLRLHGFPSIDAWHAFFASLRFPQGASSSMPFRAVRPSSINPAVAFHGTNCASRSVLADPKLFLADSSHAWHSPRSALFAPIGVCLSPSYLSPSYIANAGRRASTSLREPTMMYRYRPDGLRESTSSRSSSGVKEPRNSSGRLAAWILHKRRDHAGDGWAARVQFVVYLEAANLLDLKEQVVKKHGVSCASG